MPTTRSQNHANQRSSPPLSPISSTPPNHIQKPSSRRARHTRPLRSPEHNRTLSTPAKALTLPRDIDLGLAAYRRVLETLAMEAERGTCSSSDPSPTSPSPPPLARTIVQAADPSSPFSSRPGSASTAESGASDMDVSTGARATAVSADLDARLRRLEREIGDLVDESAEDEGARRVLSSLLGRGLLAVRGADAEAVDPRLLREFDGFEGRLVPAETRGRTGGRGEDERGRLASVRGSVASARSLTKSKTEARTPPLTPRTAGLPASWGLA